MSNPNLVNAQLNGEPFFIPGGETGVLMLHGFTATPVEVRSAADRLHALGYTVAGPLLPGHGTDPADLNRVHWQDWATAAEAEYLRLRGSCRRVFLLGESMGAVTCLYLATQHPEAAGLLLFAPAIRLRLTGWDKLRMRLIAPFILGLPKGSLDAEGHWQGYRVNPLKGALQLLKLQKEVLTRIHLIRQPVFVAQGRYDKTIDPQAGEIILQGVSSTMKDGIHWFENSSHCILIDQELDQAVAAAAAFMERVSAG
jgi:carboxylesterase